MGYPRGPEDDPTGPVSNEPTCKKACKNLNYRFAQWLGKRNHGRCRCRTNPWDNFLHNLTEPVHGARRTDDPTHDYGWFRKGLGQLQEVPYTACIDSGYGRLSCADYPKALQNFSLVNFLVVVPNDTNSTAGDADDDDDEKDASDEDEDEEPAEPLPSGSSSASMIDTGGLVLSSDDHLSSDVVTTDLAGRRGVFSKDGEDFSLPRFDRMGVDSVARRLFEERLLEDESVPLYVEVRSVQAEYEDLFGHRLRPFVPEDEQEGPTPTNLVSRRNVCLINHLRFLLVVLGCIIPVYL